ncbi:MAG: calcium/sodium antiporter [Bacteroidales bacterium]|nr:calcium/sodium antiporter [Bacteroidales bacterium]
MEYLLLIVGFILLLYGGKLLVNGGVALAERYHVSPMVIGLTVVSFGTSAPELFVSAAAALKNHPQVAIGNVIGSNIANIALVLALTAMIFPIPVKRNTIKIDAPFMLMASALLWLLMLNNVLELWEGILFIFLLTCYTLGLFHFSVKNKYPADPDIPSYKMGLGKIIILLILADVGLAFGSDMLVSNATIIAKNFNISERVIAITVVAFGTSLPELATSVIAAFRKEMDISVGNIIGSNIFNILAVLGIASIIKPIQIENMGFLTEDMYWMLGISILLFVFILPFRKGLLTRFKGAVLFVLYLFYIYMLFKK